MPFFTGMRGSGVLRREDGWSIVQLWIDMCHDHFGSLFTGVYKKKLGIWANKWFIMMKRPANKTKRHDPVSDGAVQSQACCSVNRVAAHYCFSFDAEHQRYPDPEYLALMWLSPEINLKWEFLSSFQAIETAGPFYLLWKLWWCIDFDSFWNLRCF